MIPGTHEFEEFLQDLTVTEPSEAPNRKFEVISPAREAMDGDRLIALPAIHLRHRTDLALNLDAVVRKVQQELTQRRHPTSRDIVLAVLGLFAIRKPTGTSPVVTFNQVLDSITDSLVFQTYVFPAANTLEFKLEFGRFHVGTLDSTKLGYRSARAKSDYFDRYGPQLKGRLSLERAEHRVRVVDWLGWGIPALFDPPPPPQPPPRLYRSLVENYFERYSVWLTGQFWNALVEDQDLLVAAGAPFLDEKSISGLLNHQMITIFLDTGVKRWGFVMPIGASNLTFELARSDVRIPETEARLSKEFGFKGYSTSQVHQTLRTFARFFAKAVRHVEDDRADEGFLHFVIALDLVFGERESATKSVCERVTTVTFQALGKTYSEQLRRVTELYDARSRYVHQGESVASGLVDEVRQLCREVLWVILRLQNSLRRETPLVTWIKDIDFLKAAVDANKPVDAEQWAGCGISVSARPEK